jgi:guanylate kinase
MDENPIHIEDIVGMTHKDEPLLIVISGHSAAGKDSVIQGMKKRDLPIHFVITATTRKPRENEIDGVDYFFVRDSEFQRMIQEDELIEYAFVYNEFKGVPKEQVDSALASGKDVVMRVDVQGAASLRKRYPDAVLVFLTAQNEAELKKRLVDRKSESAEALAVRIDKVQEELACVPQFDYLVVNPDNQLEQAVETIAAIIQSEHHRINGKKDIA